VNGPFDTEREARTAAHAVIAPEPGWSILDAAGNRELLRRALAGAGVTTGAYDDRIAEWLTRYEDAMVAVVAGWVTRANHPAGLIADDRTVIDRARGLAAARDTAGLRSWFSWRGDEITSRADASYLYSAALGAAQKYLADLLDTIDRITGHPYPSGGSVVLSAADAATVQAALADAAAWRADSGYCGDCKDGEPCADHARDGELAARYEELSRRLDGGA
jgi:hypothetical protein